MKEHKRVICRVRGERGDYSCAGPSLLHGDRVNCRVSGTLNGVMIVEQDLHCYMVIVYNRVNCRVSGTLNGVMIVEQDLHSYIVIVYNRVNCRVSGTLNGVMIVEQLAGPPLLHDDSV